MCDANTQLSKKNGFKHLKTGQIPSKADPEKQAEFLENELEPRLEEARNLMRILLFMDAAHFVMGAYLAYVWCINRIFLRTPSGRKRYNVLGAYNPIAHKLTRFTNTDYINSQSICTILDQIHREYASMKIPITIVLDNARYQRCQLVQEKAALLGIELLFLPSYSPNLNIIERLWRHVKKKCLYATYYESFNEFMRGIDNCLDAVEGEDHKAVRSLITTNFQEFKNLKELHVA
jgi:transposase